MAIFSNPLLFKITAPAATLVAIIGALIAALFYTGKEGERYSPLNHFISELGETGVSAKAGWFNAGLILAGLLFVPASLSLGLLLPGALARIGAVIGVLCALSLAMVGLFPINLSKQHSASAMAFFRAGMAMLIIFASVIIFQPDAQLRIPRAYALAALPGIAALAYFLGLAAKLGKKERTLEAPEAKSRPRISRLCIAEWAVFLGIVLFFCVLFFAF